MIDNKKIVDVAKQHSEESYISGVFQACYKDAFTDGAKWMQEEFLNDLWHSAEEEPKRETQRTYILGMTRASESGVLPMLLRQNTDWKEFSVSHAVTRWLYIDDLFLKEGGE